MSTRNFEIYNYLYRRSQEELIATFDRTVILEQINIHFNGFTEEQREIASMIIGLFIFHYEKTNPSYMLHKDSIPYGGKENQKLEYLEFELKNFPPILCCIIYLFLSHRDP